MQPVGINGTSPCVVLLGDFAKPILFSEFLLRLYLFASVGTEGLFLAVLKALLGIELHAAQMLILMVQLLVRLTFNPPTCHYFGF
jgi:hypothetical protein